jgi:inorganic pyrophosphatase
MLQHIEIGSRCPDIVRMVVESPKNSRYRYEYNLTLGLFELAAIQYRSPYCPGDHGFIPGTVSKQGDPLDVLTIREKGTFTGCWLDVRPIGVLQAGEEQDLTDTILAVPEGDSRYEHLQVLDEVAGHVRLEIRDCFGLGRGDDESSGFSEWGGPEKAHQIIVQSRERYLQVFCREWNKSEGHCT